MSSHLFGQSNHWCGSRQLPNPIVLFQLSFLLVQNQIFFCRNNNEMEQKQQQQCRHEQKSVLIQLNSRKARINWSNSIWEMESKMNRMCIKDQVCVQTDWQYEHANTFVPAKSRQFFLPMWITIIRHTWTDHIRFRFNWHWDNSSLIYFTVFFWCFSSHLSENGFCNSVCQIYIFRQSSARLNHFSDDEHIYT